MNLSKEQQLIADLSLEWLAEKIQDKFEELQDKYPEHMIAFRYSDSTYLDRYIDAKKAWPHAKTEEEKLALQNLIGDPGSKYMECDNNHPLKPEDYYLFLFPMNSEDQIKLSLAAIRDQKVRNPANEGVNYFVSLFLIDPAVAEDMKNNPNSLSHYGFGMYDLNGENFSLDEAAVHSTNYNPEEGFVDTTQYIDPYIMARIILGEDMNLSNLADLKERVEEMIADSADYKREYTLAKTNLEKLCEMRDFCNYVAAAQGIDLEAASEEELDEYDKSYEEQEEKPNQAVKDMVFTIKDLIANGQKQLVEVYLNAYAEAGVNTMAELQEAAQRCGISYKPSTEALKVEQQRKAKEKAATEEADMPVEHCEEDKQSSQKSNPTEDPCQE